ncbi:MAG: 50S ribosomal protein L18e [Candidatus Pacearchaeota archaeon]
MKSKTKIKKQIKRKTNIFLVDSVKELIKGKNKEIAELLSKPRRKKIEINISEIEKKAKEGDIIIVPGKVLSSGDITKKVKIIALSFSEKAITKLKKAGCEISFIGDEIKKNKEIKGKIIT